MGRTKKETKKEKVETGGESPVGEENLGIATRVRIIGGVHRGKGYSGVIVGVTRCFMDVRVTGQPTKVLRVRKTSVQEEVGPGTEQTVEEKPTRMRVTDILEMEPEISEMLLKVCVRLVEHGVAPGEAGAHVVLDAGLEVAQRMWKAMQTRRREEEMRE